MHARSSGVLTYNMEYPRMLQCRRVSSWVLYLGSCPMCVGWPVGSNSYALAICGSSGLPLGSYAYVLVLCVPNSLLLGSYASALGLSVWRKNVMKYVGP